MRLSLLKIKKIGQTFSKIAALLFLSILFSNCEPDSSDDSDDIGGGSNNGSVASFSEIPLPNADFNNLIIPSLFSFYVTNQGPYVQMQDTNQQKWSFYKYKGGSGSDAWFSFEPSFQASSYRPTSMYYENEDEFSLYWVGTGVDSWGTYGMYNVNTGTPSFEYTVPAETENDPYAFTDIIPQTTATNSGQFWALSAEGYIWKESAVVVPKKFDKVAELPETVQRLAFDPILADPDEETEIWIAASGQLFQVSEVGNPTPPYGQIVHSWDFSSLSSDRIQAILKANGSIYIQQGNKVYKQDGTSFKSIGTINVNPGAVANICTNGSIIFSSDGTYYDNNSGNWKSFIGTGSNLSGTNEANYQKLKALCSSSAPIGCLYGSASGPIYLLTPSHLISINPIF